MEFSDPELFTDFTSGEIRGSAVDRAERTLADLSGVFADTAALAAMAPRTLVYRTECVFPVAADTPAGLFWGTTFIEPGKVGAEYFMTKGHFHARADRMEAYFTFAGTGVLLLMDRAGSCRAERMVAGSTHLIPAYTAHRTVNTGASVFSFGACWPSDAGHDYGSIAERGFGVRVVERDGEPALVSA